MTDRNRVVLLVGSPKGLEGSASARLGRIVTSGLEEAGWQSSAFHVHAAVRSEDALSDLLAAIDAADTLILSVPLYVDSLPAPVIHALHRIATARGDSSPRKVPRFFSIVNCGFVEPWQNEGAQRMLQQFCSQACLEWVGQLSVGATGTMNRHIRRAFRLVIESLQDELVIPEEVYKLVRYRIVPAWLYVLGGNFMWRRIAKSHGARDRMKAQPYRRDSILAG